MAIYYFHYKANIRHEYLSTNGLTAVKINVFKLHKKLSLYFEHFILSFFLTPTLRHTVSCTHRISHDLEGRLS